MFKLLNTEFLKLKGNTSFKVFSILFIVFLPAIIFTVPTLVESGTVGENTYPLLPRDYETTWYFTAYLASWFSLFILSFILIFHITNEYAYKTVRQNIIDGYSRSDFFKSKLAMLFAIAFMATLYVAVVGLAASIYFQTFTVVDIDINPFDMMGGDMSSLRALVNPGANEMITVDFDDTIFDGFLAIVSYFLQVLAYLVFAMFIAFSLKRGAISIIVYLGAFLVEIIVRGQLSSQGVNFISDHLPLRSFSLVLPNPDITDLLLGLQSVDTLNIKYVILTTVYMVVFLVLTRWIFARRDVA